MSHRVDHIDFNVLKGKVLVAVEKYSYSNGRDYLVFKTLDGGIYLMAHPQECCEEVNIDDICGDFVDLLNEEILVAEERISDVTEEDRRTDDSCTWTFYHLATLSGDVTIRWFGASNGYYSERARLYKVKNWEYFLVKNGMGDELYLQF